MVPEEIVTTWEERQLYDGCHEPEKHVDGSEVYTIEYVGDDGKIYGRPPRRLFKAELLKAFMVKHGIRPRTKWGRQLKSIIPAAEKYEAALEAAIRISGIEDAKNATHQCAGDLQNLAWQIRKLAPTTMTGVLIQARALSAYEEAVKDGLSYPGHAGLILGRELADGVLRLCDGGRTDA